MLPVKGGIFCLLFPMFLLKDISKFRFTSMLGVITTMLLIIIVACEFPFYLNYYLENIYDKNDSKTWINFFDMTDAFNKNLYFLSSTATFIFAYSVHVGALPVYSNLNNRITRRINKVNQRSIIIGAICYMIMGIFGFLSQPINTPDLVIQRTKIFSTDIVMNIGKIFLLFTLMLKLPPNYNTFRISFLELFWKSQELSNLK